MTACPVGRCTRNALPAAAFDRAGALHKPLEAAAILKAAFRFPGGALNAVQIGSRLPLTINTHSPSSLSMRASVSLNIWSNSTIRSKPDRIGYAPLPTKRARPCLFGPTTMP